MDRSDAWSVPRAEWRRDGVYQEQLLTSAMDTAAHRQGADEQVFVTDAGHAVLTLSEIGARALRLARHLASLGVRPGDTVAVQLPNGADCAIAFRAALAAGATLVPIPSIYGDREVGFILRDAGAKLLIAADKWRSMDYTGTLAGLVPAGVVEHVIVRGADVPDGCMSWTEAIEASKRLEPVPMDLDAVSPDDVAYVIYTSGSTSDPKGARHTHNTLLFELEQMAPAQRREGARWFNCMTFGHASGFLATMRSLVFGGFTVAMEHWDAAQALELIQRYDVKNTTLPPYHLTTLIEAMEEAGVTRLDVPDVLSGSTAVQPSLVRAADAHGLTTYRCYGSSEHPTISTGYPEDPASRRADTDGHLLPGVSVRIVDEDGRELPTGEEGEVTSLGPDLFLGYTNAEATRETVAPDGYFRTGDVGTLVDGVLTITGRKKEVIIRGGENLSPKEIEDVLVTHSSVLEAAVVGRPDPRYGERAWAFVVPRQGAQITLDDVRRHFREAGIARQKTPEGLVLVDDFPRTAAGKIRKTDLKERLRAEDA